VKVRYGNCFKKTNLKRKLSYIGNWFQKGTEDSAVSLSSAGRSSSSSRTSTLCASLTVNADTTLSALMRKGEIHLTSCVMNCLKCGLTESASLLLLFKMLTCPSLNSLISK
jgi:hypothetical protein